jgi:3-oxoacyl-[acyl-carrier-protein] synthase-3
VSSVRVPFDPRVQITGTGSCVGERAISNDALEPMIHGYDTARSGPFGAWVDQVTHIHERPFCLPATRTVDMGLAAARRALEMAGVAPTDLGLIIYASFTPSSMIPGDHCVLAQELGAVRTASFVMMGACSGSIQALGLAYGMVASGAMKHVLVVGAEKIHPMLNYHDPLTAILFADGAGAAVVSRVEGAPAGTGMLPPHLAFEYSATAIQLGNSNNPHDLRCFAPTPDKPSHPLVERSLIVMTAGPSVLRNAVNNMAECVCRTLGYELADLKAGHPELRAILDQAWLVPHQANGRIVDGLADKLAMAHVMRTIYRYGNMSAASNLVALDHGIRQGNLVRDLDADGRVLGVRVTPDRIRKGDVVLLPSIGGGYLMGCVGVRLGTIGA